MKKDTIVDRVFRYIATGILVILICLIPANIVLRRASIEQYGNLVSEYGASSEDVKKFLDEDLYIMSDAIYGVNSVLCVFSIYFHVCYFTYKKMKLENSKSYEDFFKKHYKFVLAEILLIMIDCIIISLGYRTLLEITMLLTILLSIAMFLYFKNSACRKKV